MENVNFGLVIDSLMMSHWKQASSYLDILGVDSLDSQIDWVFENEPEQLLGFTKWVAREFSQYKRDTNFEFYGELKDVVKNTMATIEIANRPFFNSIQTIVDEIFKKDDYKDTLYGDFILRTIQNYFVDIYVNGNSSCYDDLLFFVNRPFDKYQKMMDFLNLPENWNLDDNKNEQLIEIEANSYTKIGMVFASVEFFINDMDQEEKGLVLNWFNKLVEYDPSIDLSKIVNLGTKLDKYRLVNYLKEF